MLAAAALVTLSAGWVLLALGVEPVPTWFYVVTWYPILVLADEFVHAATGQGRLLRGPRRVASLFGWSATIWLVFEVANFRLQNWYYVFLPAAGVERWIGILVSFATVVPAVVLAERTLAAVGVGRAWRTRPLAFDPRHRLGVMLLGAIGLGLTFGWPRVFFPLTWGAVWLIADPVVHRRHPQWSLLADAERGDWGRIGRLMLGGLGIGVLWEGLNFFARGQWIYTVPWLEYVKVFEMPPLGFLGFPFFALEAWALYHLLCSLGLATPAVAGTSPPRSHGGRQASWLAAAVFVVAALAGMERWTISSTTPRLRDAPDLTAAEVQQLRESGYSSVFRLAAAAAPALAERAGVKPSVAMQATDWARLVTLRGIGSAHAQTLATIGVRTVCSLARQTAGGLWNA
ncbi:MAG: hypothetical protein OEO17_08920, partial [Gemmatimonadota bacterium]|nr:hypothetical protein [Gemmatimonadota bacterium]